MFYIGSHWGDENDGYICSSNRMRKSYRRRPHDFKRRIIKKIHTNRVDLLEEENRILGMIKPEELGRRYYNHYVNRNHWCTIPDKQLTVAEKVSKANKGRRHNLTQEQREERGRKISETKRRRIDERLEAGLPSRKPTTPYERKPRSEEAKRKTSETLKRKYQEGWRRP
jgi:hypothetical protein